MATSIQTVFEFREIISKKDARALGKKRFFDGFPCKEGHIAERLVSNGKCIDCSNRLRQAWARDNPEKSTIIHRRNRAKHSEKYRQREDQYRAENRPKVLVYNSAAEVRWREKQRESYKASQQRQRVKWEKELAALAGRPRPTECDICGTKARGKIVFDHCHVSDQFRGWLCTGCNCALGHVKDSPEILEQMIGYLTREKNLIVSQVGSTEVPDATKAYINRNRRARIRA